MRILVLLAALLTLAQANVNGYNYDSSVKDVSNNNGKLNVPSSKDELHKDVYIYSAPDNDDDDDDDDAVDPNVDSQAKSIKRNIRIIFIRAPDHKGLTKAIENFARNNIQQKTAIYVLTKQTDLGDLTMKLQNLNKQNPNKPEVHFVKYRTPEEANIAQRIIQQQYDSLGGSTAVHNGGIGKILNFSSKDPLKTISQPRNLYVAPTSSGVQIPSGTYLPFINKFKF